MAETNRERVDAVVVPANREGKKGDAHMAEILLLGDIAISLAEIADALSAANRRRAS